MKGTVVLFGSPRLGGNSETLAEAYLKGAGEKTGKIFRFHLAGKTITGCLDCRKCWSGRKPCVIEDGMQPIYEALHEANRIVFVSPLYWYTWSGQIKPVLDRFLPFSGKEADFDLKGKKAVLVSTAGDTEPSCFAGLLFSFRTSCKLLGLEIEGELCAHDIYKRNDIDGSEWLAKAAQMGRDLS